MSYNFKKIIDLDLVNEVPEGANVLIEADGATKRLPSTAIKPAPIQPDFAQNDPTAPDYVKNRTHYEETMMVNEPLNITWDGNTEGLVSVSSGPVALYKISDVVLTNEQIRLVGGTVIFDGTEDSFSVSDKISLETEDIVASESVLFVRKDGVEANGLVFPEAGIYVLYLNENAYVNRLVTLEPIEYTKTVVKKLDRKYLPDDVEKKTDKVDVIWEDQYSNKTFDEIVRELNGRGVEALNITIRYEDASSGKVVITYPVDIALYETKITATFFGYTISSLTISQYTLNSTGTYVQKNSKNVTIS